MKFNHINIVAVLCILFSCISAQTWHQLGSYEYYIDEDSTRFVRSYSDAESRCSNLQATLAVVKTKQINDFLVGRIGTVTAFPFAFYIGLKRLSSSRYDFQWIDGTNLTSGYSNWHTGEPNGHINVGEECVIMGWVYTFNAALPWFDLTCTPEYNLRYICQRLVATTAAQTTLPTTTNFKSTETNEQRTTASTSTHAMHTTGTMTQQFKTTGSKEANTSPTSNVDETSPSIPSSTESKPDLQPLLQTLHVVAIGIGVVFIIILVVISVCFIRNRRSKKDETRVTYTVEVKEDNEHNNEGVFPITIVALKEKNGSNREEAIHANTKTQEDKQLSDIDVKTDNEIEASRKNDKEINNKPDIYAAVNKKKKQNKTAKPETKKVNTPGNPGDEKDFYAVVNKKKKDEEIPCSENDNKTDDDVYSKLETKSDSKEETPESLYNVLGEKR